MELPLVGLGHPVRHAPLPFYNEVPALPIARGYPVYHPDREPKGYMDMLRQTDPELVAFDPKQFRTRADWIKAGELVFHASDTGRGPSLADVHDRYWHRRLDVPVAADGTLPGFRPDDLAKRSQELFTRERCARCPGGGARGGSTLTPVDGFTVPDKHPAGDDVYEKSVGTDPHLALNTRKGTGFYRVPSLRGLWYRGLVKHNGSVASLEDWFDKGRFQPIYIPTGWKGPPGMKTRAVRGHEFGLELPAAERKALIAYLRTLKRGAPPNRVEV